MCGISGAYFFNGEQMDRAIIVQMTNALSHRGPDEESYYFEPNGKLALGHRRLSIIDCEGGHQPIFNEDKSCVLVFNGEIYNFQELQKELKSKGHRFMTNSDTEVIVHLYEELGVDCLSRLRGMFAFALWDKKKQELFIARDRIGKKPLYYAQVNDKFYFASEINSFFGIQEVGKEIDYTAIDLFLTHSYIPSPYSIYEDIKKLRPGHFFVLSRKGLSINQYWAPDYNSKIKMGYQDGKRELMRIFEDAVKLRLISDVPLGAFLSGGIDSSAVVALMSRFSSDRVKTFSIGFSHSKYNELSYARKIAEKYHTDHQEFTVTPNVLEIIPEIINHYGEPYGDSSALPTWYLSQMTRQHVTVALNGDGGDELFGGYDWYPVLHKFNMAAQFLGLAGWMVDKGFGKVLPRKIQKACELLGNKEAVRFQMLRSFLSSKGRIRLYHEDFQNRIGQASCDYLERLYDYSRSNDLDRSFGADLLSYLPEDLLVKVDRASMAHSLECRSPLLDQELVEFSCSLPPEWKIRKGISKFILKDAVKDLFPKGFMERPKMGFSMPIREWFRGELKVYLKDQLLDGPLVRMPLLNQERVQELLDEHFQGARNHESLLWNFLMLSLWLKEHHS